MKKRGVTLAAALMASAMAITTPAWAETQRFQDKPHATKSSTDVRWVEVTHSKIRNEFKLKVRVDRIRLGSTLVVHVDRNRFKPGPELRMVAVPDSEWALFRVNKWGQRGKAIDTCGRVRMSSFEHDHRATWRATRSCLHLRGAVRVGVKMVDPKGRTDWAPGRRDFFGRVSAS